MKKVSSNGTLVKTATVTIMVAEAHFNNTKWSSCNTRCHLIFFHSLTGKTKVIFLHLIEVTTI